MRGRQKRNIRTYYFDETARERARRLERQKRIQKLARDNDILEAKIKALTDELKKMIDLIKSTIGPIEHKQNPKPEQ